MKLNKKLICFLLAQIMIFTMLSGCGSKTEEDDNSTFSYSDGIDDNGYLKGIKALDYVEIFNYQAFPIPSDVHKISDENVQTEIDNILSYYSGSVQVTDRAVKDGDTVNIDYVGSVDGVEFENGSTGGAGTDVTIGVTNYIEGFLVQLIDRMPGETFDLKVTFPEDYGVETLNGKDAVFVTTINYISEAAESELTDEFVKTNLFADYGWETIEQLKIGIAEELQKQAIQDYINNYLSTEAVISSVPDDLLKYQEKAMLQYYQEGADYYQMDFEEFIASYVGASSKEELIESSREGFAENANFTLAALAVAESEKISVSEEDMIDFYTDYSQYEEQYGLPYLKQLVLLQKVSDYITENAVLE